MASTCKSLTSLHHHRTVYHHIKNVKNPFVCTLFTIKYCHWIRQQFSLARSACTGLQAALWVGQCATLTTLWTVLCLFTGWAMLQHFVTVRLFAVRTTTEFRGQSGKYRKGSPWSFRYFPDCPRKLAVFPFQNIQHGDEHIWNNTGDGFVRLFHCYIPKYDFFLRRWKLRHVGLLAHL